MRSISLTVFSVAPVPDSGQICSDLLMDTCGVLMVLPAEAGLLLLVDDLVEKLVKEDGQPLPRIF